jgi:hypothetical protein
VLQLGKVGWMEVLASGSGAFYGPSLLKRFGNWTRNVQTCFVPWHTVS